MKTRFIGWLTIIILSCAFTFLNYSTIYSFNTKATVVSISSSSEQNISLCEGKSTYNYEAFSTSAIVLSTLISAIFALFSLFAGRHPLSFTRLFLDQVRAVKHSVIFVLISIFLNLCGLTFNKSEWFMSINAFYLCLFLSGLSLIAISYISYKLVVSLNVEPLIRDHAARYSSAIDEEQDEKI